MKLYTCSHCHNLLYFENNICLSCNHAVGFDAATLSLVTLEKKDDGLFFNIARKNAVYRLCENAVHGTCNWMVPADQTVAFCIACQLNRTIPDLTSTENLKRWKLIEVAKHRLVYSLLRLGLPVEAKTENEDIGIAFDFLADKSPIEKIMTGHNNGTITLNIEEADEAQRVKHKLDLGEKYRTLLGHFRHEIGHYYWEVLIQNSSAIEKFRQLFGDEQKDYAIALEQYYNVAAPVNWMDNFISPYASAHPWEDWAESWAHYLHMLDTLETAYAFGIRIDPKKSKDEQDLQVNISKDPYHADNFDQIIKMWLPLTFAVNSLNRSMGHPDFYPFIISSPVTEKLRFIDEIIKNQKEN